MADHLFENQTVTSEGLNLIAHATAADAIVYTKALSNATVPADPSNVSSYSGKVGTIASASSSGNAARITLAFENSDTMSSQAVKCVALMGRLQSESGDGVIVAYCSSGESSITLPSSLDAPCVTRFVVNLVMSAGSGSTINVVESGGASLSDLSRFVSLHVAGDPTTGVNQTIRGNKTFADQATFDVKVIATNGVAAQGLSRFPKIISNYLEARDRQDQTIFNLNVSDNGASIVSSVPFTIGAGNNVLRLVSSNGVFIDGRLLPVQEYSYLGDSDHVWHYAHINELTAEEVSAGVLEAGNHAQFTYEGFVKALQVANNVPANGTFQFLTVLAARVSTGETITGGNNVKTLNIIASPSTNMSLSIQSSDTTSDQKWVAVTGGSARSVQTPTEWIFVLAVRIP